MLRILHEQTLMDRHRASMAILWLVVINIGILLSFYRYRRYAIYLHMIIGLICAGTTIITALPTLLEYGIPPADDFSYYHFVRGTLAIILLFAQVLLGATVKIINCYKQIASTTILQIRSIHMILGYSLTFLCKVQAYLIVYAFYQEDNRFTYFLLWDFFFLAAVIIRKRKFPQMQEKVSPVEGNGFHKLKTVSSCQEISELLQSYVILSNYVYDLAPLSSNHPAGRQVVLSVKNRQIDRFIYGMYKSQKQPKVPLHSHSFKSLSLIGNPVAIIQIAPLYKNLEYELIDMKLMSCRAIAKRGQTYELKFKRRDDQELLFQGYTEIAQIGRYYSITLGKITRLYTSITFLETSNLEFLSKVNSTFKKIIQTVKTANESMLSEQKLSLESEQFGKQMHNVSRRGSHLTFLIKKYRTGKLTSQLCSEYQQGNVKISHAKGLGLRMNTLRPGKIVIIAGGTGLNPFCDLIDLLFKEYLLQSKPQFQQEILLNNPILRSRPFEDFTFAFYIALERIEDIHQIILSQLLTLNENRKKLNLYFKIKEKSVSLKEAKIEEEHILHNKFEDYLNEEIKDSNLSKIYVCGPPAMNESMTMFLDKKYFNYEQNFGKYMIV